MLPEWRDIAVFLDASPRGDRIGQRAAQLARRGKAHLIGIYAVPRELHPSDGYARGPAIKGMLDSRRQAEEEKAATAGRHFAQLTLDHAISSEFRVVWHGGSTDAAVLRSLHSDLIVSAHPRLEGLPAAWSGEKLLLDTGTPVLLVPDAWTGETIGNRVVIAWNRSREARRAVNDAMPFICAASQVTILIVDRVGYDDATEANPGANLFDHLTRHGARVDIADISSDRTPIAHVITDEAIRRGADLLVLGAYSRPRTQELIFGGTTRTLLSDPPIPFLISR